MDTYIRDYATPMECENAKTRQTMKGYMETEDALLTEISNTLNQIENAFGTRMNLEDERVESSDKDTVLERLLRQTNATEQILKRLVALKEVMW